MRLLSDNGDFFPTESEYLAVGLVAMSLYALVMVTAAYGLYQFRDMTFSVRDVLFFVLMMISGACSIPCAIYYILLRDIPPFWTFVVRIISRLTFFWAFCIITNRWAKVLYLKQGTRMFHHYVLIAFNVVLVAVSLVDVVVNGGNWEDENRRCESAEFQLTILTQAVFVLGVLTLWIYLGGTLLSRIETWKDVTMKRDDAKLFAKAMKNLSLIMGITGLCFTIQFIVLLLDFIDGSSHMGLSNVRVIYLYLLYTIVDLFTCLCPRAYSPDAASCGIFVSTIFLKLFHQCSSCVI